MNCTDIIVGAKVFHFSLMPPANPEFVYKLYSSLVDGILHSKQFQFKLVRYCQKNSAVDPLTYCKTVVAKPTNIQLCYRSDQKIWTFHEGIQDLSVDLKDIHSEGKQALALLLEFYVLCSTKRVFDEKVVIHDWKELSFFSQTFSEQLIGKAPEIFSSIKS